MVKDLVVHMFREIGEIYRESLRNKPVREGTERMMSDFLELLFKNYRTHRDVAFYADRLNLTQRYFTTAVRRISGRPAMKWIEQYVVIEAEIMLRSTDLSVKEIASSLNFKDPSFFCKYFKRVVGVSPDVFRRNS